MKRFIKDNRGMTLIELLIAITILGIVAGPLLNGFLTSAQTEVKARRMGEVTSVAQNIMETVEGNYLEDLIVDYDAIFKASFGDDIKSALSTIGENNHVISLEDLPSTGARTYTATVEINPLAEINDKELSDYTSMDVVYQVGKSDVTGDRTITLTVTQTVTQTGNEIKFELEDDKGEATGSTGDQVTDSTTESGSTGGTTDSGSTEDTTEDNTGESGSGLTGGATGTTVRNENVCIYTQTAAGEMPSVYLFYYPSYKTDGGTPTVYKDTIKIVNEDNLKFDLFLIKQQDTRMAAPNLDTCELASMCTIEQYLSDTYNGNNKIGVDFYTNILERLTYTTGDSEYKDMTDTNMLYKFVNVNVNSSAGDTGLLKDLVGEVLYPFLVKDSAKTRAYEYTVKVMDGTEVLTTMTGTILK